MTFHVFIGMQLAAGCELNIFFERSFACRGKRRFVGMGEPPFSVLFAIRIAFGD